MIRILEVNNIRIVLLPIDTRKTTAETARDEKRMDAEQAV